MDIKYRIPTKEEVEDILSRARKDYSETYKSLALHGSVVYDTMTDRMKSAIYNHYRYKGMRVKIAKTSESKFLVSLVNNEAIEV